MFDRWFSRILKVPASALLAALLLIGGGGQTPSAHAQDAASIASKAQASPKALLAEDVADSIAGYTQVDPDGVRKILVSLSSESISFPTDFGDMSPVEQLRWAYSAAEAVAQGSGSEMVSAFVHIAARDTPSILDEPRVKQFVARNPSPPNTFVFVRPAADSAVRRPSSAVDRVIAAVTEVVCARGSGMSAIAVMRNRLGLSADEVLDSILKFGSGRDALANRLASMPNPPQKRELAELAVELMKTIPAARSDAVLGEAVFRWLGLDDPAVGEWARFRDSVVDRIQRGEMKLPEQKQADARLVGTQMRRDFARMPGLFMAKNPSIRPKDIERMFFEYASRTPSVGAMWGFIVISLKADLNFDPYVPEEAKRLRERMINSVLEEVQQNFEAKIGRPARISEVAALRREIVKQDAGSVDWSEKAREHGPKPYHGYVEYSRLTGYTSVQAASSYARSSHFNEWVEKLCPASD